MTVSLKKLTLGDLYPGWKELACGCCAGMAWGDPMRECDRCGGSGGLWLTPSGTRVAQWPGGPFAGIADDHHRAIATEPRDAKCVVLG